MSIITEEAIRQAELDRAGRALEQILRLARNAGGLGIPIALATDEARICLERIRELDQGGMTCQAS